MKKLPRSKEEIEWLVITELHRYEGCEKSSGVLVIPIFDDKNASTWTVSRFNAASSDGYACDRALQQIVPSLQRIYDLVQKH